jgi:diguanylate cyclase (GGDEF)-like protein
MSQKKLKRPSVTLLASVFVIAVCVSLLVLDGLRSWDALNLRLQEMESATGKLTFAVAQHADNTFKAADLAVTGIVERVEHDGASSTALHRLHQVMQVTASQLPQIDTLIACDEHGTWLASSGSALPGGPNLADRAYFLFHQTHPDRELHISAPVISRFTHKWVVPVSRRINHPDGSFGGVALATLDVDYFNTFYQSLDLGHDGAMALITDEGVMLVHRPFNQRYIGKNISTSVLYQSYLASDTSKGKVFKFEQDGTTRWTSYHSLDNYPLFVAAGFAKQDLLADWRRSTIVQLAGTLLLALLLALFGARLIRQIKLRVEAEAELTRARDTLEILNRKLEKLAMQDGLTLLANRRHFDITLAREFSRATRQGSSLALVMIDIDFFKQFNDLYGHPAGDDCLRNVSRAIKSHSPGRPGDLAARYGGEEMAIILPETDLAGAMVVAQRLLNAIHELEIPHRGSPSGTLTISAGVDALIPLREVHSPETLIQNADKALYMAKTTGRDRVCSSRDSIQAGRKHY